MTETALWIKWFCYLCLWCDGCLQTGMKVTIPWSFTDIFCRSAWEIWLIYERFCGSKLWDRWWDQIQAVEMRYLYTCMEPKLWLFIWVILNIFQVNWLSVNYCMFIMRSAHTGVWALAESNWDRRSLSPSMDACSNSFSKVMALNGSLS